MFPFAHCRRCRCCSFCARCALMPDAISSLALWPPRQPYSFVSPRSSSRWHLRLYTSCGTDWEGEASSTQFSRRDSNLLNLPHFPTAPQSFWFALTVASVIGSVVLISRLSTAVLRVSAAGKSGGRTLRAQIVFVLVVCAAYLVGTAVSTSSPVFS